MMTPVNHAVNLKMTDGCMVCRTHYGDFLFKKQDLFVNRCGHVFDRACLEQMEREAAAQGKIIRCPCKKRVADTEPLAYNLWGKCAHETLLHEWLPVKIEQSLLNYNQIVITNCGHLLHGLCWLEIREANKELPHYGICPDCKKPITDLKVFEIRPYPHKQLVNLEMDIVVADFVKTGSPASSSQNMKGLEAEFEML